jgi:hypothetical protein
MLLDLHNIDKTKIYRTVETVSLSSRMNKAVVPIPIEFIIVSQCGQPCYPSPMIQSQTVSLIQSAETESYIQQQQRKSGLVVDTFGYRKIGTTLCKFHRPETTDSDRSGSFPVHVQLLYF